MIALVSAIGALPPSWAMRKISSVRELPTALGRLLGGLVENVLLDHSEILLELEVVHSLGHLVHLIGKMPYRIVLLSLRLLLLPFGLSIITVAERCPLLAVY
jgi:hypothetical protein